MNRRIAFLCACLLATLALQAQTLTGKLIDEKNQPLPYANIVLLSLPDSAFVTYIVQLPVRAVTLEAGPHELHLT